MHIIAMVPARMGSERLKQKNLALLDGEPLISYAIQAATNSGSFDQVVVNSDGKRMEVLANRYGVNFYYRDPVLASSQTKSDDVIYDFIKHYPCDVVAWVNPISPLQTAEEVHNVVQYFLDKDLDSLITVGDHQVHCIYENDPINFSTVGLFEKTQDLIPVQSFVYSVMMWKSSTFTKEYEDKGYALLCGKLGYYAVSKESAIIIKTEGDLMIAESIIRARQNTKSYVVKYDELADLQLLPKSEK